jgi:hypothetical protein
VHAIARIYQKTRSRWSGVRIIGESFAFGVPCSARAVSDRNAMHDTD